MSGVHAHRRHAEELLPVSHSDAEWKRQGYQEDKPTEKGPSPFHLLTRKTHACQAQMPMKGGSDAPVFILNQASKLAADLRLLKIHTESQAKLE